MRLGGELFLAFAGVLMLQCGFASCMPKIPLNCILPSWHFSLKIHKHGPRQSWVAPPF